VTGAAMTGINIPGVPKWFSPGYKYGPGVRKTYDPDEMEKMRVAIEEDRKACGCWGKVGFIPDHNTGFVGEDWAWTYHCRSWSRWYNPETEKMEGHAHCTCDSCF
jgi:hypothetical protein